MAYHLVTHQVKPQAHTSSVGVGSVGETPDVPQAHAVANAGQQEVQLACPVAPVCSKIHVQVYITLVTGGHQQVWGDGLPVRETKDEAGSELELSNKNMDLNRDRGNTLVQTIEFSHLG